MNQYASLLTLCPAAFAGLFYLSIYLAGKLHVFDTRGEVWKSFVVMIPTLAAALIAISRIMDARHHPFDVISGSFLGVTMAYISYRQYFPPLSESWRKGRAYPIRSWASGPRKPRSDERQMSRDQGVEPLRSAPIRTDEEQPEHAFQSPRGPPPRAATYAGPEGNVFRQQISKSQRHRQAEFQHRNEHSMSSVDSEVHTRASPFSHPTGTRGRQRQSNREGSSSSSDHGASEEGFEMERNPRSTTRAVQEDETHPAYRLTTKDFEQDTRYHSPARSPKSNELPSILALTAGENMSPTRDEATNRSK